MDEHQWNRIGPIRSTFFYAVDHSANKILEQRLVSHSFRRLSYSSHTLSRWPWSVPLHRNNTSLDRNSTSLGPQPPPRFEGSRLLDLNHLTCTFHGQDSTSPCLSPLAAAQDTQPLCHATARNRVAVEYKCFSLPLQLRDRCVSSTSLLLLQILVHKTQTLLTTRP